MTKPLPEWKRKDRILARRSRAFYFPSVKKGKGKLAGWEIVSTPGSRPGEADYYLRRPRDGVTMPYRKVRFT